MCIVKYWENLNVYQQVWLNNTLEYNAAEKGDGDAFSVLMEKDL